MLYVSICKLLVQIENYTPLDSARGGGAKVIGRSMVIFYICTKALFRSKMRDVYPWKIVNLDEGALRRYRVQEKKIKLPYLLCSMCNLIVYLYREVHLIVI